MTAPPRAAPRRWGWHGYERCVLLVSFGLLALGCLTWSVLALPLALVLRARRRARVGRWVACMAFRAYLKGLTLLGAARFDLSALDSLRDAGPMIIAANHPGLLDAPMLISRLPNLACILKASLLENILWGAGSRLAGYIRNDWFIGSVNLAVAELRQGSPLLLFPEGSRTRSPPRLNRFRAGASYIAYRARVPVQTVFIEQDTRFLCKDWPLFKRPNMPMHFRVRLGRRFAAPTDPEAFSRELQDYFASELNAGGLP